MTIQKIYERYKIMSQLQLHQLRVAGVASIIVDGFEEDLDRDSIISAALLHDMGNVIKFRKEWFFEMVEDATEKDWQKAEKIKKNFIKKYGDDEHAATIKIIQDLGLNGNIVDHIKNLEFSNSLGIANSKNINRKIIKYSDLRVTPYGVDTLKNRLSEAKKRYVDEKKKWTPKEFRKLANTWIVVEKQIFAKCKIAPEDITEEKVEPLISDLRNYKIKTK